MSTNPEASYDVSVDYNMLNDGIAAIKDIKSKCSQLISDLSSVDVSILDSAGEMAAAIATAEGVMDGPVELVLGRIMEVETLFYMMQNEDFFVDLQAAMESGKFNDEEGNLDIAAVMEHIIMNADGRYQDLLEDEDFRKIFVEQNILSVYGISSMEELEAIRNGFLEQTQQYETEKNGIVYDASHMTKAFLNKLLLDYDGFYGDFDTVAGTTIMAYSYTDASGVEIMVDSLDQVPKAKQNEAKALSFTDICGDSDEYQELKGYLDGSMHLSAMVFKSGFSEFEERIDANIEASEVRLAELDNLINGEDGSRTKLTMANAIVDDVNSRTKHLSTLYGFMINDDFEAMSSNLAGDEVAAAIVEYKNGLAGAGYSVTNISVDDRSDEMNILYSLISGNGEFTAGNGTVSFMKPGQRFSLSSDGDDTLSNYAYWAEQMTEDEQACFYYVWNTQGQDAAYDYLQGMSGVLDNRWVANQMEIDGEFASEHKVAASVISVLANPFEGFAALKYSFEQWANDDNMTRTQTYSHGDTMRQQVSRDLSEQSEFAGFAYNVGMSMADNMYSMVLTGGNAKLSGLILGVSSYNDSLNDALDRGLTDDQARMFATASAGVEMLAESLSIDSLLKKKPIAALLDIDVGDVAKMAKLTDTQKGFKKFFGKLDDIDKYTDNVFRDSVLSKISNISNSTARNITFDAANVIYNGVKQGIGEGNEELITGIFGRLVDDWIADENSSYNISVQSYINQGYTEAEAFAMANSEYRDELVVSWLSGAASGTTMGGGQTAIGLAANDIKINGMLSDYKSNPNYEAQLGELRSNMREGHYDTALTMVVDSGTSYEQGMQDANKIVDSMLNKGMINEKGKTQLTSYLEADAKAHTVLAGTSYETGNNLIRSVIRQDIMDQNIGDSTKYDRGLNLSLVDSLRKQNFDDANKIINNMEQNGIITSEQRDNMLVGVENATTASDMAGHLQKGDAAATLAARRNPTVVAEEATVETTNPTASDSPVAAPITATDSDSEVADGVASDLSVAAGSLGLGLTATGTAGLGTTIATLGTETDTSTDNKGKIYSDERIVIEDDSREAYEQHRTPESNEVSQSQLLGDTQQDGNSVTGSDVNTDVQIDGTVESDSKIETKTQVESDSQVKTDAVTELADSILKLINETDIVHGDNVQFTYEMREAIRSFDDLQVSELIRKVSNDSYATNFIFQNIPSTRIKVALENIINSSDGGTVLSDISASFVFKILNNFSDDLDFMKSYFDCINNKSLGSFLRTSYGYGKSTVDSLIEIIDETRLDEMIKDGSLKYNADFIDSLQKKFFDSIRNVEVEFGKISENGKYGVEQSILMNSRSYVVKGVWSGDLKSLTDFIATEYKKFGWTKANAKVLAKKMMTPGSKLSGTEFNLLAKYVASNPKYSVKDILNTKFKRVQTETYTRLLNKYESMGMDRKTATKILDCIDTTGICSYADVANLIVDKYKNNPEGFKQDFGFDLYVELDGKKVINDAELLADMYITINSDLCGGSLFKYENGKFNILGSKIDTKNQKYMSGYTHNVDIMNKYLSYKNLELQFKLSDSITSTIESPVKLESVKSKIIDGIRSGKQVSLVFCTTEENSFHLYDANGKLHTDTANWRDRGSDYEAHAVYVTGITETDLIVSSWGQRFTIPLTDFNDNKFGISISEITRNQINQEALVTEVVEAVDMIVEAKQNGYGDLVGFTSEITNKIKYLKANDIVEMIQKYDDSTGVLSQIIANANFNELNLSIMQLVNDGKIEFLLSKFDVLTDADVTSTFSTLSNYVSSSTYTAFVDAVLATNSTHSGLISTLSDSGIVEIFNKHADNQTMLTHLFNNLSQSQYTAIYNEYFNDGFTSDFISETLENAFNDQMSDKDIGKLLDAIYNTNNSDAIDFANEIMSELGNDKINEMIADGTLTYNSQFNPLLRRQIHKQINQNRDGFLSKLGGQYGVDQNAVGRNIKYSISKPWVADVKDFANFIKESYKWDSFSAYFEAVRLNTPFFHIDSGDVRTINKYLASKDSKGIKETLDLERDILKRTGNSSYKQLHREFSEKCVDSITAARILGCIDTTGACSYAAFANVIVNSYKNNPEGFKQDFGFDLYIDVNGKQQINSQQLLLDMYVFMNSMENGGKLFKTVDGKIALVGKTIDTSKQKYVSTRTKFNDCAFKYLESKNSKLTITYSQIIDATNMSSNELRNAVGKALQADYQLKMYVGRDLEHIIPFKNRFGTEQSTANWKEDGAHAVYVTGMTDTSVIVSSWGKRYTIPFDALVNNPEAAFVVSKLENMSSVTDTAVATTTMMATEAGTVIENITDNEFVVEPRVSKNTEIITSLDTSNLDAKSVADLLTSIEHESEYSSKINEIFKSLSDDKFFDLVRYMNENNMFDCDMIGALDPKLLVNKLEILYDNSPELISPFIDTIPGMIGSIIEDMFTSSSNVNYGMIEHILNTYDNSHILTIVNDSPSLKNSLDMLPRIKDIYISEQQNTFTPYEINETSLSVSLFTMDRIDSIVNGDSSIDIISLLNDSSFNNDALTILLDKLIKNNQMDIKNSIINSLDSGRLFEIINQAVANKYDFVKVVDTLSTEQFVSFVEQLSDDSVKNFLEQVSLEKLVSVYDSLRLSGRMKLDHKIGSYVDMTDLSIYKQKQADGSMETYIKGLSDSEFNEFIGDILKNNIFGISDLAQTIMEYDSTRINQMIENGTLEYHDKLPASIEKAILDKASVREKAFEKYADGVIDIYSNSTNYSDFGIDQDVTRKHVKFTVKDNSWMKDLDQFAEFIVSDAKQRDHDSKMTKGKALEIAKHLSTTDVKLSYSSYDIITRYLANNYSEKDALRIVRDSFTRENSAEYKRVLDKLIPYAKDVATATRILDSINTVGVCSYASVANIIFDYYKDMPHQFKQVFGFDLYVEIDGEQRINEIELLTDMYITINGDQMNGKLFRRGGLFGKGKLQTFSSFNTKLQTYLSNSSVGVKEDILNKYLSLKKSSLAFSKNGLGYEGNTNGAVTATYIKKMFISALREGNYIDLGIYKSNKKITLRNPDGSINTSTFDWNEGDGHAVYVVGVTNDSVVVSSWGKKLLIPFEDLVDNKFTISFLSKTNVPVTVQNAAHINKFGSIKTKSNVVETAVQNDGSTSTTVSVGGSNYEVSSKLSFKDRIAEKYYDSVLKRISNKANNSDLGYGTVSAMLEKSMGNYFRTITSGNKIYDLISGMYNKHMIAYAVNTCDLSLLSDSQLETIINKAIRSGYEINEYSSEFMKSSPDAIMRTLNSFKGLSSLKVTGFDNIFKKQQKQEKFIRFINSINYDVLTNEQKATVIAVAVDNGYYISEKSPSYIKSNIDVISKIFSGLTEKFHFNQTINNIDYSSLSESDLLMVADAVAKCSFGLGDLSPISLRSNVEFVQQMIKSTPDNRSINSKLSFVDFSSFSDQQLLDTMKLAMEKGYVLDVHSPIERLNGLVETSVKSYLETVSPEYRGMLNTLIDNVGYSALGIEGYDGIFSEEMLNTFGVDFVTDIYKYCNLTGSKVNFESLIKDGKLATFKQIFDKTLGTDYRGNFADVKYAKKIIDKYISNPKLFTEIMNSSLDNSVIDNFRKYVNSNFRIKIDSLTELQQFDSLIKEHVNGVIASGNVMDIQRAISLLLFNESDMYDFTQKFGDLRKLDALANKINNSEVSEVLKGYSVLLKFYQNKIASNKSAKSLISICEKLNNMSYDDRASYLKMYDDIEGFVKYCYGLEANQCLTKLDSIVGTDSKDIRVDGKYTWQDGSKFVAVDYVEINSNYRLFQHTLNAYGSGGKITDYQNSRMVGKTYLCLSMIGDNKIGVVRETSDVDHVTLLFDSLVPQDLMACAPRDIGSGQWTENNDFFINDRGARFDVVDNILSNTASDSYNEYVVYRNNAKPSGILVTGQEANSAEIEAAAKLGVPLVKINYSGKDSINISNNSQVLTDYVDQMREFVGYVTGKNGYTVARNSNSGQIIYDGNNSQVAIDVSQEDKSLFGNNPLEKRVLSSMDSMVEENVQFVQSKVELSDEQNLLVQNIVDLLNGANELSAEIKNRISMLDSQSAVGLLDYYFNVKHDLVLTKEILNSFKDLSIILESFINDSNAKDLVSLIVRRFSRSINIDDLINHFDSLGLIDKFINLLSDKQLSPYFNYKNDMANYILSTINSESFDSLIERGLLARYFNLFDNDEIVSGPFKNCSLKIAFRGDGARSDYVLLTSKSIQVISGFMNSLNTDFGNIDFGIETLESIKKFDVKTVTTLLDILSQNNEYSSIFGRVIQNLNDNILVEFVEKNIDLPNFDMILSSFNLEQLAYIFKNCSNNELLLNLCSKYSSFELLNLINSLNDNSLSERILSLVDAKYVSEVKEMITDGVIDSYIESLDDLLLGEKIIHLFNQNLKDNIDILEKFIEHIDLNRLSNMIKNGTLKYCSALPKDIKIQLIDTLSSEIDGVFSKFTIPNHYGCNQRSVKDSVEFTIKSNWVSDMELLTDTILKFFSDLSRDDAFKMALSMNNPGSTMYYSGYKIVISYLEASGLSDLQIMDFMRNNFSANPVFKNLLDKYVSLGSDAKTIIEILNCIDTTGVCTYAKVANIICNTFKNNPDKFEKIFGVKLFVEHDGKLIFNDAELLADMYIRINSIEFGGKLFTYQNGKVDVVGDSIDTAQQVFLSNDGKGIDTEIVNRYFASLGAKIKLITGHYDYITGLSKSSTEDIRHKIVTALQDGMNVSLDVRPSFDSEIDFYINPKTIKEKLTRSDEGHAIYLTGIKPNHLCVSTWGNKRFISLKQLLDVNFSIDFSNIVDIDELTEDVSGSEKSAHDDEIRDLQDDDVAITIASRSNQTQDSLSVEGTKQVTFDVSESHHDAVSVDSSRKGILGISKNSMLEMKLTGASNRTIDSMIKDGKLTEYLNSLTSSEIYNGPLARHVYQFANKMELDAMGDSFVLLTNDQFDSVDDFMDSIDDDLSQGFALSQESVDMMDAMSSEELVVVIDKLLSDSEYFESAKQVVKFIDDSLLGELFDKVMVRDDSKVITSYLDADQVVTLMNYYSEDSVSYNKFCRNVSYAKFSKVAKVLNEMISKGNLEAARMRSRLDKGIDSKFVSDIRNRQKNGTLSTYLNGMTDTKIGRLIEKMIDQKMADAVTICDSIIDIVGQNRFSAMVRNGDIKFDTRFSQKTQKAILDIINQQRDGSLKELSVYGVDQGYIRSHIRYEVRYNWSDDISDISSYLSKNYGLGVFEAEAMALNLTSPTYRMDYEEHQMVVDYLTSKYGKSEALRMSSKICGRKVDSRYMAALNKLVSHGTDIKTAQAILDCIDTTGVCSYASVANLIVEAYKDNPTQFKKDFGFDLYTYENGRKEINSTELLADMYVYMNSNLCGGRLFTITNGRVTTNTTAINTENQVFLSSNQGFRSDLVNKYLHSKNPNVSVNVTSASQFYADGVNSEVDNIKTAIVRAIQEGKQVTLGVYRTKGSEYKFLDENGVKRESTVDWSEGDGHAVYVTGVTDNGVVVSTWGKRRVIPFSDFINNEYRINFVEMAIDGSVRSGTYRPVSIYSNPDTAIHDGKAVVMDGVSKQDNYSSNDDYIDIIDNLIKNCSDIEMKYKLKEFVRTKDVSIFSQEYQSQILDIGYENIRDYVRYELFHEARKVWLSFDPHESVASGGKFICIISANQTLMIPVSYDENDVEFASGKTMLMDDLNFLLSGEYCASSEDILGNLVSRGNIVFELNFEDKYTNLNIPNKISRKLFDRFKEFNLEQLRPLMNQFLLQGGEEYYIWGGEYTPDSISIDDSINVEAGIGFSDDSLGQIEALVDDSLVVVDEYDLRLEELKIRDVTIEKPKYAIIDFLKSMGKSNVVEEISVGDSHIKRIGGYLLFDVMGDAVTQLEDYFGDFGLSLANELLCGETIESMRGKLSDEQIVKFDKFLTETEVGKFIVKAEEKGLISPIIEFMQGGDDSFKAINDPLYDMGRNGDIDDVSDTLELPNGKKVKELIGNLDSAIELFGGLRDNMVLYKWVTLGSFMGQNNSGYKELFRSIDKYGSHPDVQAYLIYKIFKKQLENRGSLPYFSAGFMSTSPRFDINWMNKTNIVLQILAPAGTPGAYINQLSPKFYNQENEFLLARKRDLKIVDVSLVNCDGRIDVILKGMLV